MLSPSFSLLLSSYLLLFDLRNYPLLWIYSRAPNTHSHISHEVVAFTGKNTAFFPNKPSSFHAAGAAHARLSALVQVYTCCHQWESSKEKVFRGLSLCTCHAFISTGLYFVFHSLLFRLLFVRHPLPFLPFFAHVL